MKRIIPILLAFFLVQNSFAQRNMYQVTHMFNFYDLNYDYQTFAVLGEQKVLKEHKVKSRVKTRYHKGKPIETIESFNEDGKITSRVFHNNKKQDLVITFEYDAQGRLSNITYVNTKDQKTVTTYKYDNEDRLIEKMSINDKGEKYGSSFEYNESGKLLSNKIYKKDKETPFKQLVYTYYENGDKKTTDYFKKGKLKYSWKFDCKPEGELVGVKNKDQSTICISEEWDENGNRIVWEREFDEDGKLRKFKTTFNADSVVLSKQLYSNEGGRLVYDEQFKYDSDWNFTESITTSYPKKGDSYLSSHSTNSELEGHKTERFDKKGKMYYTSLLKRNDEGLIVKSQHLNGRWSSTYLYAYDGQLKMSEVIIYRRNTLVNEFAYTYYE